MKDNNSLAHSTWNCKYHLVFAPKYRRMQIYGQIRKDIGVILRRLCKHIETDFESVEARQAWDEGAGMEFTNANQPIAKEEVIDVFTTEVAEEEVIDVDSADEMSMPEMFK